MLKFNTSISNLESGCSSGGAFAAALREVPRGFSELPSTLQR